MRSDVTSLPTRFVSGPKRRVILYAREIKYYFLALFSGGPPTVRRKPSDVSDVGESRFEIQLHRFKCSVPYEILDNDIIVRAPAFQLNFDVFFFSLI